MLQVEPKPRVRDDEKPRAVPETMHDREECGQEVASDLTLGGMTVFLSVAGKGINLLAAGMTLKATMPVRIVADTEGKKLKLKPDDAKLLSEAGGVIAFLLGEPDDRERFYLPIDRFLAKATLRDGRHTLEFEPNVKWLMAYEGHAGVKKAFAPLIKKAVPKVEAGG
ncbi:hypothetical protein [Urbifossiella limnaea]|uniref:Uncharacterized protein n=1 Tax=Urbifossiella limnaea TaxID=2528023 RepID=A0A517XW26_9BACT|nr:hypothetical protein [Urbifossiella limnaea]QDU21722.1 hypothetical protein ETAA1_36950 [Urbifossiella limnaea]